MLDIKFIRENADMVKKNTIERGMVADIDRLLEIDILRRQSIERIEELRALRNKASKGKPTPAEIEKMKSVGEEIKKLEANQSLIDEEYESIVLSVPNLTAPDSPIGGEESFIILESRGGMPIFDFEPKDHEELLTTKNMLDFERGAKVAGSKFYYPKGDLVRLNQALINYGMEVGEKYGYTLMETPDMAKQDILMGAGFNPRGTEKQIYNIEETDLSLIGTAEITVLGYHRDEILDFSDGPKKYIALSHCFRTEGGAYGRTSKGLYRVHQFTKLEMFVFCKPEKSESMHMELLAIEKEICDNLEFPYRVIDIPSGDLGAPAYKKYDLEAHMVMVDGGGGPGYGEITSTSNCTDYQARRMNIRYKNSEGKNEYVHTLNGTAVVLSRFPIAIVENLQNKDGSIRVPLVLQKFMGKEKIS